MNKEKLIEFLESEIMSCRIVATDSDKAIEWECKRILDRINAGMFEKGDIEESNVTPRTIDEWHEDIGDVLWWSFPIEEPPYCGSPLDTDWPDYHTHWTPIITPRQPQSGVHK